MLKNRNWQVFAMLLVVSALAYLPHLARFGYFRDDWYLMYSANALGVKTFQGIFAGDRPARAILMTGMYTLFGLNPFYYNLAAYVFRLLGGISFYWTLKILWPRQQVLIGIAALIFLIYPGFISTPNAIDYEEKFAALMLGHLSIALSLQAVLVKKRIHKILLWLPSIVFGGMYLSLVEYYLGFEVLRLLAIGLLVTRATGRDLKLTLKQTLFHWLPFMVGPLWFVVWRFYIFDSARKATDLGAQFGLFLDSPLLVGTGWATTLLKNSIESIFLSWGVPLMNFWDTALRLRELVYAGVIVAAGVVSVAMFIKFAGGLEIEEDLSGDSWSTEALWIGLICVVTGFIPVIVSNRGADFYNYSRYMLPSAPAAAILLIYFLGQVRSLKFRNALIYMLVISAILTHYFNGLQWARSSEAMRDFWWQVSWRIPQIKNGTTLVVNYSDISAEEDYFVWGPANLLYHPQSGDPVNIRPALSAAILSRENLNAILSGAPSEAINRRTILTNIDFNNILILSRPSSSSCVQVLDAANLAVSELEQNDIKLAGDKSDPTHILLNDMAATPNPYIFGMEPQHGWCYFYETASLAYQKGDWQTVLDIKDHAAKLGLAPADLVEWMPFIQSAALLGDKGTIADLAQKLKKSEFLTQQACQNLTHLPHVDSETGKLVRRTFCVSP